MQQSFWWLTYHKRSSKWPIAILLLFTSGVVFSGTISHSELTYLQVSSAVADTVNTSPFRKEVIDTRFWRMFNVPLNRLLDRTPGVRVRQRAGLGSESSYLLNGAWNRGVAFFIDGIPLEYLGQSYSVNNFATPLVNKIEVYPGVTPVGLGSHALGGAINVVTHWADTSSVSASYSLGSFNTHQAHLKGQWVNARTRFTSRLSAYYTASDNNYDIWGFLEADEQGRVNEVTKDNAAEKFNDDVQSGWVKLDLGVTKTAWADEFLAGVVVSGLERGIQQTIGFPLSAYGEVRTSETLLMPTLSYQKDGLLTPKLSLDLFASYALRENTLVDTSRNWYNLRGEVVRMNNIGGERSESEVLNTTDSQVLIVRVTPSYQLFTNHRLSFNYLTEGVNMPTLHQNFLGLNLSSRWLNDKLSTDSFVKYYGLEATTTSVDSLSGNSAMKLSSSHSFWGVGLAAAYRIRSHWLVKYSMERAVRMPSVSEALGNGFLVMSDSDLEPERSLNLNLGVAANRIQWGDSHYFSAELNGIYRNTENLIILLVSANDFGSYRNFLATETWGWTGTLSYQFRENIHLSVNHTFLDVRNNFEFPSGGLPNPHYRDRFPNLPYSMANINFRGQSNPLTRGGTRVYGYLLGGQVGEYFLGYEGSGQSGFKTIVPEQWVLDAGLGVSFRQLALTFDVSNVADRQNFDFLDLQRPGRAFSVSLSYGLNN